MSRVKNSVCFIVMFLMTVSAACSVEQRYMPAGYVRDDVIYPYYAKLSEEYFKKVNSGQIEFNYKTYRNEVEKPLGKITDELFKKSRYGF